MEEEDVHLCLRCKMKISGLGNYVAHRREQCLDKNISVSETALQETQCNRKETENASHFFTSLELKSITGKRHNELEIKGGTNDVQNTLNYLDNESDNSDSEIHPPKTHTGGKWEPGSRPELSYILEELVETDGFPPTSHTGGKWEPKDSSQNGRTGSNQDWVKDRELVKDPTVENYPPKHHTGGKWEPGTRPHLTNEEVLVAENFSIGLEYCQNKSDTEEKDVSFNEQTNENDLFKNSCKLCEMEFDEEKQLFCHHFTDDHKAKFAGEHEWSTEVSRYQHKRVYYLFPYQCKICSFHAVDHKIFSEHLSYKSHLQKTAQLRRPMLCLTCQFDCHSSDAMLKHVSTKEHIDKCEKSISSHPVMITEKSAYRFHCSFCPDDQCSLFVTKCKLLKNIYDCQYCEESFSTSSILRVHVEKCHRREQMMLALRTMKRANLICTHCPKTFQSTMLLKNHFMRIHSAHTVNCDVCNRLFISVEDFNRHKLTNKHKLKVQITKPTEGNERFNCDSCPYYSSSKIELCVHTVQHTGPVIRRQSNTNKFGRFYICLFCSKLFSMPALKNHLLTHTRERPFACQICPKHFAQKATLRVHMKLHSKPKSFSCNLCAYKTTKMTVFKKHKSSHKTEHDKQVTSQKKDESPSNDPPKLFLCDICGHDARSLLVLKRHQRLHTGEKPFKCHHCDYHSASNSNVLRHMRLHSGSKPYKCPYCAYLCNTQENIRKHILKTKKHAGKKVYPCKHCDFGCNEFVTFKSHMLEEHKDLTADKDPNSIMSSLYIKDYPRQFLANPKYPYQSRSQETTVKSKTGPTNKIELFVVQPLLLFGPQDGNHKTVIQSSSKDALVPKTELKSDKKKANVTQYRTLLPKLPKSGSTSTITELGMNNKSQLVFTLMGNQQFQLSSLNAEQLKQDQPMVSYLGQATTNQLIGSHTLLDSINSQNTTNPTLAMTPTRQLTFPINTSSTTSKNNLGDSFRELVQATCLDKDFPFRNSVERVGMVNIATEAELLHIQNETKKANCSQGRRNKLRSEIKNRIIVPYDKNQANRFRNSELSNSKLSLARPDQNMMEDVKMEPVEKNTDINSFIPNSEINYIEASNNMASTAQCSDELVQFLENQTNVQTNTISISNTAMTEEYENLLNATESSEKTAYFNGQELVIIQKSSDYNFSSEMNYELANSNLNKSLFQVIENENPTDHSVVLLEIDKIIDEETGNLTEEALQVPLNVDRTKTLCVAENPESQSEKTIFIYTNQQSCIS